MGCVNTLICILAYSIKLDKGTPSNSIEDIMTDLSTKNDAFVHPVTIILLILLIISAFIGYGFCELVVIISFNAHGWFYSNLSLAFIIFVYFIFFHCISKRYKLRKRDDIVPIYLFAEEFVEKELRGRERLIKKDPRRGMDHHSDFITALECLALTVVQIYVCVYECVRSYCINFVLFDIIS